LKYRLTYEWGGEWMNDEITSAHYINDDAIRTFQDFLSTRNMTHGDVPDIEKFLGTGGVLLSGSFSQTLPLRKDSVNKSAIRASLALPVPHRTPVPQPGGYAGKFKKIFACVYGPENIYENIQDIYKSILAFLVEESEEMLFGLIADENSAKNTLTVKMLAICSGD
jgi:hypothetical protein